MMLLLSILSSIFHFKPTTNTIKEAFSFANEIFTKQGVSEPTESARYLICKAANLGYGYSDFNRALDQPLMKSDDIISNFNQYCSRRLKGEPIQYILGDWDFYGLTYKCKQPILIPRPETEELVDYILNSKVLQLSSSLSSSSSSKDDQSVRQKPTIKILDIGAGSGIIGITLLHELIYNKKYYNPNQVIPSCVAIDINPVAIALSRENADNILKEYSSQYNVINKSFLEYVQVKQPNNDIDVISDYSTKTVSDNLEQFDLIVSNPPYIPSNDIPELQDEVKVRLC